MTSHFTLSREGFTIDNSTLMDGLKSILNETDLTIADDGLNSALLNIHDELINSPMPCNITLSHRDILQQSKYSYQLRDLVIAALHHQVLLNTAETQGLIVSAEDLQHSADRLRIEHQLLSAKDTLTWLETYHFTLEDFENLAYISLIRSRLSITMFDSQVETYFADRQLDYVRALIYEVIVSDHELAMELFYALQEHETDFLAVFHQYSSAPKIQSVRRPDVSPELSAIIFTADFPRVQRPILTAKGSHLIYVADVQPAVLTDELRIHIREELFDGWLESERASLEVTLPEDLGSTK